MNSVSSLSSSSSHSSGNLENALVITSQQRPIMERVPLGVLVQMSTYLYPSECLGLRGVCSFLKKSRIQTDEIIFATSPLYSNSLTISDPRASMTALNTHQIIYGTEDNLSICDVLGKSEVVVQNTSKVCAIAVINSGAIAYATLSESVYVILPHEFPKSKPLEEDPEMEHWPSGLVALNSHQVACSSYGGRIAVWDIEKGNLVSSFQAHELAINAIEALSEQRLVSASQDMTLKVWNMADQTPLHILKGHEGHVYDVAALGKNHIVSASSDQTLILWDLTNGTALKTLRGHKARVQCVTALSNHLVASGSLDQTIKIWDAFNGTLLRTFPGKASRLTLLNKYTLVGSSCNSKISMMWDASLPIVSRAIFNGISETLHANINMPFIPIITDYLLGNPVNPRRIEVESEDNNNPVLPES